MSVPGTTENSAESKTGLDDNKADSSIRKLTDLLQSFPHAMLVTRRDGNLRSRPMSIGDVTGDGRIRFISRDDSAKLDELDEHPGVNVAAQQEQRFLSLTGRARISESPELIDRAWQSQQAMWFRDGKSDPHVVVIEVVPTFAEYWDRSAEVAAAANDPLGDWGKIDFGEPRG